MMVEAEATETTCALVTGETPAPRPRRSSPRASRRPSRSSSSSARRSPTWPPRPPSRSRSSRSSWTTQDDVFAAVEAASGDLGDALTIADKQEREGRIDEIKARVLDELGGQFEGREKELSAAFRSVHKKLVRQRILRDKVRIDGRGLADIRPLSAEVEVLPRVHGSALFERGETQILGVTTLNMLRMEQQLDTLSPGDAQALHAQLQLPAVLHR